MKVDRETLRKLAHLARLEISKDSEEDMLNSLSDILTWVEKLSEVDTDGVLPLTNMTEEVNQFREDKAINTLEHDKGLLNAPKKDSDYFRVPKVLE